MLPLLTIIIVAYLVAPIFWAILVAVAMYLFGPAGHRERGGARRDIGEPVRARNRRRSRSTSATRAAPRPAHLSLVRKGN